MGMSEWTGIVGVAVGASIALLGQWLVYVKTQANARRHENKSVYVEYISAFNLGWRARMAVQRLEEESDILLSELVSARNEAKLLIGNPAITENESPEQQEERTEKVSSLHDLVSHKSDQIKRHREEVEKIQAQLEDFLRELDHASALLELTAPPRIIGVSRKLLAEVRGQAPDQGEVLNTYASLVLLVRQETHSGVGGKEIADLRTALTGSD